MVPSGENVTKGMMHVMVAIQSIVRVDTSSTPDCRIEDVIGNGLGFNVFVEKMPNRADLAGNRTVGVR